MYSQHQIVIIFNECRSFAEVIIAATRLKYLCDLGEQKYEDFIRKVSLIRTEELT